MLSVWKPSTEWEQLASGDVDVWRAPLEVDAALVPALCSLLTTAELGRTGRRRSPRSQEGAVASRALVRLLVARYTGVTPQEIRFDTGSHGKPQIRDRTGTPAVAFNLSHSDGIALVAIALEGEIGVDIERIRPGLDWRRLAGRYYAPQEVAWLQEEPEDSACESFFRLWTCKEAVVKALGVGMSLPFSRFAVTALETSEPRVQFLEGRVVEGDEWQLIELCPGAGFAATLAVRRTTDPHRQVRTRCWEWGWGNLECGLME